VEVAVLAVALAVLLVEEVLAAALAAADSPAVEQVVAGKNKKNSFRF
jgi:hypothetical protein